MTKFFGILEEDAEKISGLLPPLSAAEMLNKDFPHISSALLRYSQMIVENFGVAVGVSPEITEIRNKIVANIKHHEATSAQLEDFGDNLAKCKQHVPEMARLAMICYAATTIHGPISANLGKKIASAKKKSEKVKSEAPISYNGNKNNDVSKEEDKQLKHKNSKVTLSRYQSTMVEKPLSLMLAEISKEAFKHKDMDIAMTALTAAIKELEK